LESLLVLALIPVKTKTKNIYIFLKQEGNTFKVWYSDDKQLVNYVFLDP
jgi:hypothetical protein